MDRTNKHIISKEDLDGARAEPLFVQLKTLIQNWISSGEFSPNERIFSERELSEMYHISRQTVRQAINELVLRGILFRQPGKGTYVAQDKVNADLVHVGSFINMLRGKGKSIQTEIIIHNEVVSPPFARELLQLAEGEIVEYLVRVRYLDNDPVAIHKSYLHPDICTADEISNIDKNCSLSNYINSISGLVVLGSEETLEPTIANSYEAELLGIKKGAPLQLIEGRLFVQNHKPIECHKSLYRGDKFRFNLNGRSGLLGNTENE